MEIPPPPHRLTASETMREISAALTGWIPRAVEHYTNHPIEYPHDNPGEVLESLYAAAWTLADHNSLLAEHLRCASEQADAAGGALDTDHHDGLVLAWWHAVVAYLRKAARYAPPSSLVASPSCGNGEAASA